MKKILFAIVAAVAFGFALSVSAAAPVVIAWNYSSADIATYGVTGFVVERKAEACAANSIAWSDLTLVANTARNYTDTTVVAGTTYCYRVTATAGAVRGSPSNTAEKFVIGPPPAPTGVTAT